MADSLVVVDFFLVPARTGGACPPVSAAGLRKKGGIDASHMEVLLAPVALHRLGWWAPGRACFAMSECVSEIRDDFLLSYDIFVT